MNLKHLTKIGYRWTLLVILMLLSVAGISAQSFGFRVTEVDLSDGQSAQIIPLYQNFDFFRSMARGRNDNFADCAEVWPIMNEAFGVDVPDNPHFQYMRRWDVTSDRIDDDVVDIIGEALQASSAMLASVDIQVCLVPAPPDSRTMASADNDLYAIAYGDVIMVAMGGLSGRWQVELETVMAHEYHHTVRATALSQLVNVEASSIDEDGEITLLERIVTEGMAVVFAQMVVPQFQDPVYEGLSASRESDLWAEIIPQLESTDEALHRLYIQGRQAGVPVNAGYTIGYHIVQAYIANNPDVSLEEWTQLSAQDIYDASGYNP